MKKKIKIQCGNKTQIVEVNEGEKLVDILTIHKAGDIKDILVFLGFAKSKGEVRRKINEGAIYIDGKRILIHDKIIRLYPNIGVIIKLGRKIVKLIDEQ